MKDRSAEKGDSDGVDHHNLAGHAVRNSLQRQCLDNVVKEGPEKTQGCKDGNTLRGKQTELLRRARNVRRAAIPVPKGAK